MAVPDVRLLPPQGLNYIFFVLYLIIMAIIMLPLAYITLNDDKQTIFLERWISLNESL